MLRDSPPRATCDVFRGEKHSIKTTLTLIRKSCEPGFRHVSAQCLWKLCGDLQRQPFSIELAKWPTSISEICRDAESAHNRAEAYQIQAREIPRPRKVTCYDLWSWSTFDEHQFTLYMLFIGVCLGHDVIGLLFGLTLTQDRSIDMIWNKALRNRCMNVLFRFFQAPITIIKEIVSSIIIISIIVTSINTLQIIMIITL